MTKTRLLAAQESGTTSLMVRSGLSLALAKGTLGTFSRVQTERSNLRLPLEWQKEPVLKADSRLPSPPAHSVSLGMRPARAGLDFPSLQ